MYEFLISNPILTTIFFVVVVLLALYLLYKYIQKIGLERVRAYAYEKFVEAEHEFQHGENTQKFEYVVQLARSALPSPFKFFITEKLLRTTIQLWFDVCKDLLDDGVVNGTAHNDEQ